jgi:hypothetical protein
MTSWRKDRKDGKDKKDVSECGLWEGERSLALAAA